MKALFLFTSLLGALTCACGAPVTNLEVADFDAKAADPAVFLVDVRTPEEYAEGHLRGAANVDWNAPDFLEQVEAACPKDTPVAVYCRTGRRSAEAAKKLSKAGYAVCNLVGGIEGWQAAGKAVTKYAVETFFTDSGLPVRITLIKHGTLEIVYKGLSLQVDPVSGLSIPTDPPTTPRSSRRPMSSWSPTSTATTSTARPSRPSGATPATSSPTPASPKCWAGAP